MRSALNALLERHPTFGHHLDTDPLFRRATIAVLGASRDLARLLAQQPRAIDVLTRLDEPWGPGVTTAPEASNRATTVPEIEAAARLHYLHIAGRDLVGLADLEMTIADLTDRAAHVFQAACDHVGAENLTVIGMGKAGGQELNYSSDVDVMFVGDGPREDMVRQAQQVVDIAGRCFRVDTNLRPEGRDGALVRSLDSFESYWDRWAEPWEFQALLKARPLAGDAELGARFLHTAQRWLWTRPFDADALRSLRLLKARAERAAVGDRAPGTDELKRSPGGIRDIEFTAQLLQLVHGHLDPHVRSPNTLTTLDELGRAGYVDPADAATLADAYRFLRTAEHRLQLVDGHQTHTVPRDHGERLALARTLGYLDTAEHDADVQFETDLRRGRNHVRTIHQRVYFRPLLEAFAGSTPRDARLSVDAASARLAAFGFTDANRTQTAVRELTKGLNRSSRMMQQLLPLLLDWLSEAPDPDLGLLMLRNLLGSTKRSHTLVDAFRDSPEAARQACTLLGTSRLLADIVVHNPDIVARLPHPDLLATRSGPDLIESAEAVMRWRTDTKEKRQALRRWKDRNLLGIASRDLFGFSNTAEVETDLSALAAASLDATLAMLAPSVRFAIVGLGHFGAGELSYSSDLDVLFVYEGDGSAATEEAARVATSLLRFLGGDTPIQRVWDLDLDLRPEGRRGALARRVEAYVQYWDNYAEPWERMAMTRARVVAGDVELGQQLLDAIAPQVWGRGLPDTDRRAILRSKARMESERIPAGEDPRFHLKLGRGSLSDIEFTVQLSQLRSGIRGNATVPAIDALVGAGEIHTDDARVLTEAFRFCERTRNRWFLVNSAPSDALPLQPEPATRLARSLHTSPTALREDYRRLTRRSRRVVERLFYGVPQT